MIGKAPTVVKHNCDVVPTRRTLEELKGARKGVIMTWTLVIYCVELLVGVRCTVESYSKRGALLFTLNPEPSTSTHHICDPRMW